MAVIAVIIIGEIAIYGPNPYTSSADVEVDEEGYTVSVTTDYPTEYTILATHSDANPEGRYLLIYRDFTYGSFIEDSYLDYWIELIQVELEIYGFTDYMVVDAQQLSDMMSGSTVNGNAGKSAVLMLTGALPSTVYGYGNTIFEDWLASGGAVYWSGGAMGMYVALPREESWDPVLYDDDPGQRFFGIPGSIRCDEDTDRAEDPSADRYIGQALNIFYDNVNFGVSSDVPDSLFIGCEKDGYNSIALSRYAGGTGMVCIFGGEYPPSLLQTSHSNILKVFLSGLFYDSKVVLLENGEKSAGTVEVEVSFGDYDRQTVFVYTGSMLGTYGRTYYVTSGGE